MSKWQLCWLCVLRENSILRSNPFNPSGMLSVLIDLIGKFGYEKLRNIRNWHIFFPRSRQPIFTTTVLLTVFETCCTTNKRLNFPQIKMLCFVLCVETKRFCNVFWMIGCCVVRVTIKTMGWILHWFTYVVNHFSFFAQNSSVFSLKQTMPVCVFRIGKNNIVLFGRILREKPKGLFLSICGSIVLRTKGKSIY